jgi:hypothetical protein
MNFSETVSNDVVVFRPICFNVHWPKGSLISFPSNEIFCIASAKTLLKILTNVSREIIALLQSEIK